ncbi:SH3 domain-containing protein [Pseudonocardia nematodicida]|uniref:SH3 domain-containing protein n=1 Tax=Pseudonocardia nematodicida TaxID=1206997 RepID=A0ABV1KFM8_9PSEU
MTRRTVTLVGVLAGVIVLTGCARTSIEGLQVRSGPGTGHGVVGTIPEVGTPVRVECWQRGEAIFGDTVWYRIASPEQGWVTNYYVRTTGDFGNRSRC